MNDVRKGPTQNYRDHGTVMLFEPSTTLTFLPKCPGCGSPHPRALNLAVDNCPTCNTFCPTGATKTVPAALTGYAPWTLLARLCLWLGRQLARLARSF